MQKRLSRYLAPMITVIMLMQSLMPGVWAENEAMVARHHAISQYQKMQEQPSEDLVEVLPDDAETGGAEESAEPETPVEPAVPDDSEEGPGIGNQEPPAEPTAIPPTPVVLPDLQALVVDGTCEAPTPVLNLDPVREQLYGQIVSIGLDDGQVISPDNSAVIKVIFADNHVLDTVNSYNGYNGYAGWQVYDNGLAAKMTVSFDALPDCETPEAETPEADGEENADDDGEPALTGVELSAPTVAEDVCEAEEIITLTNLDVVDGVLAEEIDGDVVAGNDVVVRVTFDEGFTLDAEASEGWTLEEDGTAIFTVTVPECEEPTMGLLAEEGRPINGLISNLVIEINRQPAEPTDGAYTLPEVDDRVDFTFDYTANAAGLEDPYLRAGDYFEFTIANYSLLGIGADSFDLVGCGDTCGTFSVDANGNARITLNEAAAGNGQSADISGDIWFWASEGWAIDLQQEEDVDVDLNFGGNNPVTIIVPGRGPEVPPPPGTAAEKKGWFTNHDQGRIDKDGAITWEILAPEGPSNGVTLTDVVPADAGWTFDQDSVKLIGGDSVDIDVSFDDAGNLTIVIGEYDHNVRPGISILANLDEVNPVPNAPKTFTNTITSVEIEPWEGEDLVGTGDDASVTQAPGSVEPGSPNPVKTGKWVGDQGTNIDRTEPIPNAIVWTVRAPAGPADGVVLTDEAPAGTEFVCDSIEILGGTWGPGNAGNHEIDCSPSEITVTFGRYLEWNTDFTPGFQLYANVLDDQPTDPRVMLSYTNLVNSVTTPWGGQGEPIEGSAEATAGQTAPDVPNTDPEKYGEWNTRDRGEIVPEGAITWHLKFPVGPNGYMQLQDLATPQGEGYQWVFTPDSLVHVSGPEGVVEYTYDGEYIVGIKITYPEGYGFNEQPYYTIKATLTSNFVDGRDITNEATTTLEDYIPGSGVKVPTAGSSGEISIWQESGRGGTGRIGEYKVSIGDFVWFDESKDGIYNGDEDPVPGTKVNLYLASNPETPIESTTTDDDGYYYFADLDSDQRYTIEFIAPDGLDFVGFTYPNTGDGTNDSRIVDRENALSGRYTFRAPTMGFNRTGPGLADNPNIDAGFVVETYHNHLVTPEISGNVCTGGTYQAPAVTFGSLDGPGISYSGKAENGTITATATLLFSYSWDNDNLPSGWTTTTADPKVATYTGTYTEMPCIPTAPVTPDLTLDECLDFRYVVASITAPEDGDGVTYSDVKIVRNNNGTYTVTATATVVDGTATTHGYSWNAEAMPENWRIVSPAIAQYSYTFDENQCATLSAELPTIEGNTCVSGAYVDPVASFANTDRITYTDVVTGEIVNGKFTVTATATLNFGFGWDIDNLPEGWSVTEAPAVIAYSGTYTVRDCVDTAPVEPTITGNVCDNGMYTAPTVTFTQTDGVSYSSTVSPIGNGAFLISGYATIQNGYEWGSMPAGWTEISPTTAVYVGTFEANRCEPVVPVAPDIDGNVCADGAYVEPEAIAPTTDGLSYEVGITGPVDGEYTVTATATFTENGIAWGNMPEGWTRVSNTEATYEATLAEVPCETVAPAAPTVDGNVCVNGAFVAPTVSAASTDGITYSDVEITGPVDGLYTVTAVATITNGNMAWGELTEGWTPESSTVAKYEATIDEDPCETVVPVAPTITGNVCTAGAFTPPSAVGAETDGVTYSSVRVLSLGNNTYNVLATATLANGYEWGTVDQDSGWMVLTPTTAFYVNAIQGNPCDLIDPVIPTIDGNVCVSGAYVDPTVVFGEGIEGVTFDGTADEGTITATATIEIDDIAWDFANLPEGWSETSDPAVIEYEGDYEEAPCEPIVPVLPEISGNVCEGGVPYPIQVTRPANTDELTYTGFTAIRIDLINNQYVITGTATIVADGVAWDEDAFGDGWTRTSATVASYSMRIDMNGCEEVIPAMPTFQGNVCEGGVYVEPSLRVPANTDVITYGEPQIVVEDGVITVTLTAQIPDEGYMWSERQAPFYRGWEVLEDRTIAQYTATHEVNPCEPIVPELPVIDGNVCEGGVYTAPSASFTDVEGVIAYTDVNVTDAGDGTYTVTATATIEDGYAFDATSEAWPEDWTVDAENPAVATYSGSVTAEPCEPVIPNLPTVSGNVCEGGFYTEPSVSFGEEIEGVTLSEETIGGGVISATAVLDDGYAWNTESPDWPEDWAVDENNPARATYASTYEEAPCAPVIPVNPVIDQAICTGGSIVPPSISTTDTDRVSYEIVGDVTNGGNVTIVAKLADGYEWDWESESWPEGWFVNPDNLAEATLEVQLENIECTPVVPEAPIIEQAVCENGGATTPSVELPTTPGITYTKSGEEIPGGTVIITAELEDGYEWGDLPEGWTIDPNDPAKAIFEVTQDVPCTPVVPAAPVVEQAVCENGQIVPPSLQLPTTPGITYTTSGDVVPGGTVIITATLEPGYEWGDLPEGWTLVDATNATFSVTFDDVVDCEPATEEPDEPEVPGDPEEPVVVTELPTVGSGSDTNHFGIMLTMLVGMMLAAFGIRKNAMRRS